MSEENKAIMRRALQEVVAGGNLALVDELTSPEFVDHTPFRGLPPNREGVRQGIAMLRQAFPDLSVSIDDIIAEDDKVVARYMIRGTHEGAFMDIEATGEEVAWMTIMIFRVQDGQITDQWLQQDQVGLMQQLGALPPMGG